MPRASLLSASGPRPVALPLEPAEPVTIGRAAKNTLVLDDPSVSREHARLTFASAADGEERILLDDLGSTQGTWLNGVRLTAGRPVPLQVNDTITIGPWTLRLTAPGTGPCPPAGLAVEDELEADETVITRLDARIAEALAQERLTLLLNCAAAIHSAADERHLAEAVLDAALMGTGFANGVFLRPRSEPDHYLPVASRGPAFAGGNVLVSRSLLRAAAAGTPASLSLRSAPAERAQSIVELGLSEALCVPIRIGAEAAAFLYLDHRASPAEAPCVRHDAAGFAAGVAQLAGLALANLQRLDVERRHAGMEAELAAAAAVQQLLLPRRAGRFANLDYQGECRPGRYLEGDFFDVIPLDDRRLAVALGDVAGKGVVAAVLVTAAQGFLNAALRQYGEPAAAVNALNRFLHPRCPPVKFMTLWVGIFDTAENVLSFVDAGHGYALLLEADRSMRLLRSPAGGPVGIVAESGHTAITIALQPGGRLLVLSDGIVEAFGRAAERKLLSIDLDAGQDMGLAAVQAFLRTLPGGADEPAALFAAVTQPADPPLVTDDATALAVKW